MPNVEENAAEGQMPSRLIYSDNLYLLQHAFDPINWYTWGEDAFRKTRM